MEKDTASLIFGSGLNILLGVLQIKLESLPMICAVLGYIVGIGLMLFGIIGFLRRRKKVSNIIKPKLELSKPILVQNHSETVIFDGINTCDIEIGSWRLSLKNTQQNSQASNVSIRITKSKPRISILPVNLRIQPALRGGETLEFDVIGFQDIYMDSETNRQHGSLYIYRSDINNSVVPVKVPDVETVGAMQQKGITFTIAVFADLPTKGITRKYRAFINDQNQFILESSGKTNSR